jgi:hypothetical protein
MRIAINTETRQVVTWANEPLTSMELTRGDKFPLEIKFIAGAGYVELPAGAAVKVVFKQIGQYGGQILAGAVEWVKAGAASKAVYTVLLDMNTIQLNAALGADTPSIDLAMEIEWRYTQGSLAVRQTATPVPVTLSNDYIRGAEGSPVDVVVLFA